MKSFNLYIFFVIALCGIPIMGGQAFAQDSGMCNGKSEELVRSAYPDATKIDTGTFQLGNAKIRIDDGDAVIASPHMVTCRIWPANPDLTLVAVPLLLDQADDTNKGDLELLVVNTATLAVKYRLRLENRMTDGSMRIDSLNIDTGRYRLRDDQTAFGIRILQTGSSAPNPSSETNLWLYVIDQGALRPVLDGIVVSDYTGEWDMNCSGEFLHKEVTLSIDSTMTNGYRDIISTQTSATKTTSVAGSGECKDVTVSAKPLKRKLKYDGNHYQVPEDMRPLTD